MSDNNATLIPKSIRHTAYGIQQDCMFVPNDVLNSVYALLPSLPETV